jgi:molybdate transport system permease protein
MAIDWQPLWLTLELAALTTVLLLLLGIPLATWLAGPAFRLKPVAEAIISLPLVLPPSVLGFYLLLAFSPANGLGRWLEAVLGLRLVFSFPGLVLGSMIYSLPFMVQPLQAGLEAVPASLKEASYTLGHSRLTTLLRVQLPLIKPALVTGMVLSFAHTIGEFGLVLMIGGNIPGQTRVASIAIYNEVETLNYAAAHTYSLVLLLLSFSILLSVYLTNKRLVRPR